MFYKVLLLTLTIVAGTAQAIVYFPQGITILQVKNSKNIQVAWDIHNVLAQKDGLQQVAAVVPNFFDIIWTKITGNKAWQEIAQLPKGDDPSGEARYVIFLKHGQYDLALMVEDAANAYRPRAGMEQIVFDIAKTGITQRLASNIGPKFLINLDTKFKKKYGCKIFDVIKAGKIIDYSKYGKNPIANRGSHLASVGKPNPLFYDEYNLAYVNGKNSIVIFIDDKLDNVITANKAGWVGIHFDLNKKDPVAQLRADLKTLGILY